MMRALTSFGLALVLVACGGGQQQAAGPDGHGHGHGHGEKGEHGEHGEKHHGDHEKHGNMTPALEEFHHVLAPAWHSQAGETRVKKACDSSQALTDKAAATNDAELVSGVAAIAKACGETGRANVEPALSKVHERFHALVEHH